MNKGNLVPHVVGARDDCEIMARFVLEALFLMVQVFFFFRDGFGFMTMDLRK
jgi:hypothetical protein